MTAVAIFGANGYLGSIFHNFLKYKNIEAFGVVRQGTNLKGNSANDYLYQDFYEKDWFLELPAQVKTVINFIGPTSKEYLSKPNLIKASIINTLNGVIRTINLSNVKRVINISSIHVYSGKLDSEYTEESLIKNNSPYALGHIDKEKLFKTYLNKDIKLINLRLGNVFGAPSCFPGDFENLFINQMVKSAIDGAEIEVKSNRFTKRNFLAKNDLCLMLEKLVFNSNIEYVGPLNFGGKDMSLKESVLLTEQILQDNLALKPKIIFKQYLDKDEFTEFKFNTDLAKSFGLVSKNNFCSEILSLCDFYNAKNKV